jgi:tetratricopeptide (TPR) repeat protein
VLGSLMQHHPDVFPGIVLVVQPDEVGDWAALEDWLDHLLRALASLPALSGRLRVVLPTVGPSRCARLAARRPDAVRVVHGRYAMQGLARELLAQSGERGPGAEFRRLFVELTEAVSRDDAARLESRRAAALEVARARRWPDQAVVVHLLTASAYLKRRDYGGALTAYRQAGGAAGQAIGQHHPAGHKLAVNALFGEASVQLMNGAHAHAAHCYERAAAAAALARDAVLGVEAWRMSALCWHRAGERDHALEAGFNALDAGRDIDAAQRANGNLRLVIEWMIQQVGAFGRRRGDLEQRVSALFPAR